MDNELNRDQNNNISNDAEKSNEIREAGEKAEACCKYLSKFKDVSKLIFDENTNKSLVFINHLAHLDEFRKNNLLTNLLLKYGVQELFVRILNYSANDLRRYLNTYDNFSFTEPNSETLKRYKTIFLHVNTIIDLILHFTDYSRSFTIKFHENGGTKILLEYINDETFITDSIKFKNGDSLLGLRLLRIIIGSIHNVTKISSIYRKEFDELKAALIITKFARYVSLYEGHRVCAHMALANVVNDSQIETLDDTKIAIEDLIKLIRIAANSIAENNVIRVSVDINENGIENANICVITYKESQWSLVELIDALYRISVNDKIKFEIFEVYNLKAELEKIVKFGNEIEIEYALKLLWQLCFDHRVAERIYKHEKNVFDYISKTVNNANFKNKQLKNKCSGILWLLNNAKGSSKSNKNNDNEIENASNDLQIHLKPSVLPPIISKVRHIMISYNKENRILCLKIKKELEKNNHRVWIDFENIHGSSLESMAKAIEDSKCVLCAMSEKYKESPNCRAEAEYAFRLNIPIIPLIMQKEWFPDGWLGIILGSKIYVNFTKYTFEECIRRLLSECESISSHSHYSTRTIEDVKQVSTNVFDWSNDDVNQWLLNGNIDSDIKSILKNFDGKMLNELNMVRLEAPEYFFNVISNWNKIEIIHVLKFTSEFKKLF